MLEHAVLNKAGGLSVAKSLAVVAVVTFVVALVVQLILETVAPATSRAAQLVADAVGIAVIVAPLVYFTLLVPLARYYRRHSPPLAHEPVNDRAPITDTLTRTLSRQGITIGLFDLMALAERYTHPLSVAMIDIDRLGEVNAEHGQNGGDHVLASVAGILADALRMPDRLGRYTDNEFLIVLPETEIDDACSLAERIRANTAGAAIDVNGKPIKTTISIGVTQYRRGEDLDQLISRAEAAIHDAKDKGRDCVVCTPAPADPRKHVRVAG